MTITYDPKADTLTMRLNDEPIAESDAEKPGIIFDFYSEGNLVAIEILDASRHVPDVTSLEFRVAV